MDKPHRHTRERGGFDGATPYPPSARKASRPFSVILTFPTLHGLAAGPDALIRDRDEPAVHEPGDEGH